MHRYDVLGPLRVDGREDLVPHRPAQRRLLAILLLDGPVRVARDVLVDRMWPTRAPSRPTNTLQAHVSGLRRTLGTEAIVAEAGSYRLAVGPEGTDAQRFGQLVARARSEDVAERILALCDQACDLWRGPPFPELADDDFAQAELERLVELHIAARSMRASALLDLDRWHEAAAELQSLVILRPGQERLWELLMLARYRAGRGHEALETYREARQTLAGLGFEPGAALRQLERRMLARDPDLLTAPVARPPARREGREPPTHAGDLDVSGDGWPLVGRAGELARIGLVIEGVSPGLVLVGRAGVGKSRLLREAARDAIGARPVVVRANPSLARVPLGAVTHLARLGPGPVAAQLQQLLDALRAMAGPDGPPLLLVDDAHHLDEATLGLIAQALQTGRARVIATLRPGQGYPPAVTTWWKDLGLERHRVPPLADDEVEQLLTSIVGATTPRTRARLIEVSGGNPMHLRELLRAAQEEGVLVREAGAWRLRRPVVGAERLTELVELAVDGLSDRSRQALEALSVARPLPPTVLDEVAGPGATQELWRAGLAQLEAADRSDLVDVAHPLFAENLAARLSPSRRRTLARRLADAIERSGLHDGDDLLRVALLRLEGDDLPVELALAASREALMRMDAELAHRLAAAATAAGGGAEAWLLQGRSAWYQADAAGAEAAFERATELADPAELCQIDSDRAAARAFVQQDPAGAVALLDDVLAHRPYDREAEARLRLERSLYLAMTGRMREVIVEAQTVRALVASPGLELRVGVAETLACAMLGQLDGLVERIDALMALAQATPEVPLVLDQLGFNRVQALLSAGDVEQAKATCQRMHERVANGVGLHTLWLDTQLLSLIITGEPAAGLALVDAEGPAAAQAPDPFQLARQRRLLHALLLFEAGRDGEARALLGRIGPEVRDQVRDAVIWRVASAWSRLPDRDAAASAFVDAGRVAVAQGHASWSILGWYGAVRVGRADLAVDGLEDLASSMSGAGLVEMLAESASAHAKGDAAAIATAAGALATKGFRGWAAEGYATAAGLAASEGEAEAADRWRRACLTQLAGTGLRTPALASLVA